jgi:hypothetical protein
MRAPLDIPDILADAMTQKAGDPDEHRARARWARGTRRRFRLPGWLTEVRRISGDGPSLPVLRDYPWRSSNGA